MKLDLNQIKPIIQQALAEDIGAGDVTTQAVIPEGTEARGKMVVREEGITAGLEVAQLVFKLVDEKINFSALVSDGTKVKKGQEVAEVKGPARGILMGERVALNFLQRLSGVATLTSKFVERVKDHPLKIMDTRKTTPNLRALEKYAVRVGGGDNHRMGLYDAVLIKDNHLTVTGGIKEAVSRARQNIKKGTKIEVETSNLENVKESLESGANTILLDNMEIGTLEKAVNLVKGWNKEHNTKIETEASGGVTLDNVVQIAKTGVDVISIGALTHSAPALDISLEIG